MTHVDAMRKAREIWGDDARCRVTSFVMGDGRVTFHYEVGFWDASGTQEWGGGLNWKEAFVNAERFVPAVGQPR